MSLVGDDRIEDLVAVYETATSQIVDRFVEMSVATAFAVRLAMRDEVRKILTKLRQDTLAWLTSVFGEMVEEGAFPFFRRMPASLC